jgi:hypothetical protein
MQQAWERREIHVCTEFLYESAEEWEHLEDPDIDEKVILKLILTK